MLICLLIYLYVYVGVVHAYNGMHVEVKEQALEVHSLILPYGSQSLNSGRQVWQQVSLPSGQSYQACFISFIILSMEGGHMCHSTHVEVREQLGGIGSSHILRILGIKLGHQGHSASIFTS